MRQASQTTEGVVTYEAVLEVDNSTLELRPGMTATAELTASRIEGAVLVPNAALRFTPPAATQQFADNRSLISRLMPGPPRRRPGNGNGNGAAAENGKAQRVWVLREGRPSAVPIEIGATDGKRTQVVSGDVTAGLDLIVESATKE